MWKMEDTNLQRRQKVFRSLDWLFAVIAAFICILVAGGFSASQFPDLWPFPGLYFIELVILAVVGVISRASGNWAKHSIATSIPWINAGILLSFVILGALSIGLFLFPAMLAFLISGIFADLNQARKMPVHAGVAIIAALVQSGLVIIFSML
jgi:hypothetical protein